MFVSFCLSVFYELAAKHPVMSKGLLLAKHEDPKDRSVARIISIQFIPAKRRERQRQRPTLSTRSFYLPQSQSSEQGNMSCFIQNQVVSIDIFWRDGKQSSLGFDKNQRN
jgi:hypothetical protein